MYFQADASLSTRSSFVVLRLSLSLSDKFQVLYVSCDFGFCSRVYSVTRQPGSAPPPPVPRPSAPPPAFLGTSPPSHWEPEPTPPPSVSQLKIWNDVKVSAPPALQLVLFDCLAAGFGANPAGGGLFGNKSTTGALGTGLGTSFGTGNRPSNGTQ